MIDADERSLQLPMLLAAQQSINTLIFGVKPHGKVSPASQVVDCKNKTLPAFSVASRISNRANTDNKVFASQPVAAVQPTLSRAFGATREKEFTSSMTFNTDYSSCYWGICLVQASS